MKTKCTIFLIVLLSFMPLTKSFAQGGTWESDGEIPLYRVNHAALAVDSIIYVIGGNTYATYPNASPLVQAYDPIHKTWEEKAPMLTARHCFGACVLNDKIYTIGGSKIMDDVSSTTNIVEVYDPATDEWTTCANLPEKRVYLGATAANGKIYVVGGMLYMAAYNNLYVYTPETDSWATRRLMPTPRNYICACSCDSGMTYVFGGAEGVSNIELALVEMYDPTTNLWHQKCDMLTGIQLPQCCKLKNKIYIMRGRTELAGGGIDVNYEYDPDIDTWNVCKKMPIPRVMHSITAFNDKIYVIGGTSDGDFPGLISTIHVYTPPATAVAENKRQNHPVTWSLFQNYPNPFNPSTTINYSLTKDSNVKITVYNTLGQVVAVLADGFQSQGLHRMIWNAQNQPSGIYIYRLEADGFSTAKKMFLQK